MEKLRTLSGALELFNELPNAQKENLNIQVAWNGSLFSLIPHWYIINGGAYFILTDEIAQEGDVLNPFTPNSFISFLEDEAARDDCWGDIYTAPMTHLGNCNFYIVLKYSDIENEDTTRTGYPVDVIIEKDSIVFIIANVEVEKDDTLSID